MSADLQAFRERAIHAAAEAALGCAADDIDRYTRITDAVIVEFAKPNGIEERAPLLACVAQSSSSGTEYCRGALPTVAITRG